MKDSKENSKAEQKNKAKNPDDFSIDELRQIIDDVDTNILSWLATRFNVVKQIGKYKKKNKIAIYQEGRWQKVIESIKDKSEKMQINPEFSIEIWEKIHDESKRLEE